MVKACEGVNPLVMTEHGPLIVDLAITVIMLIFHIAVRLPEGK